MPVRPLHFLRKGHTRCAESVKRLTQKACLQRLRKNAAAQLTSAARERRVERSCADDIPSLQRLEAQRANSDTGRSSASKCKVSDCERRERWQRPPAPSCLHRPQTAEPDGRDAFGGESLYLFNTSEKRFVRNASLGHGFQCTTTDTPGKRTQRGALCSRRS